MTNQKWNCIKLNQSHWLFNENRVLGGAFLSYWCSVKIENRGRRPNFFIVLLIMLLLLYYYQETSCYYHIHSYSIHLPSTPLTALSTPSTLHYDEDNVKSLPVTFRWRDYIGSSSNRYRWWTWKENRLVQVLLSL